MKVLIISDSHGLEEELFQVLRKHEKEVELMIHCGDSELPKALFNEFSNLLMVGGNCDYDKEYDQEITTMVSNYKVFITHGHMYNVKSSAVNLSYRAEEFGAKLVCYGHSHIAVSFQENGVVYINPGSFKLPRKRKERTYVLINFKDNVATVTYYDHTGTEILDLKNRYDLV
ncbi:metallophosphoesterase [Anaerobacillus alkaliphilus]|uniref:Phosphoesterase n=1 Tax=Anaerobacillus alkaliphilus TaxID=1548597 RepID=A0A4Q0VPP8_9BACI|nr:metallophosphoesterase [Anaerobacillus alkaliphilus]RXI98462.1 metallophosphoesterase [Anaerobacillus alkaliphilus]